MVILAGDVAALVRLARSSFALYGPTASELSDHERCQGPCKLCEHEASMAAIDFGPSIARHAESTEPVGESAPAARYARVMEFVLTTLREVDGTEPSAERVERAARAIFVAIKPEPHG